MHFKQKLSQTYGHTSWVESLFGLQNGYLASGSGDQTIKIWNPNDGTLKQALTGHSADVKLLLVLPNGGLASASKDKTIKIWSPKWTEKKTCST